MWIVRLALRRPYTFAVFAFLILVAWRIQHPVDADGHFSEYRYSRSDGGVELHRTFRAGDVDPHRLQQRTRHDHDGQRYRAHRVAVAERHRRDQDLFPAPCERRQRGGTGDCHLPGAVATVATRNNPALHHSVQRIERARAAVGPERAGTQRTAAERPGPEQHSDSAGDD